MRNNYRDHDEHSRSRSREKDDRDYSHKYPSRENSHRNLVKLHVGNLPLNTSEETVQMQFQRFGRVDDIKIMRKNANGQPLREFLYGFIVMSNEEEAKRALEVINRNTELGWQVSYSKEKPRGGDDRRSPERYHHHQHQHQHQYHGQHQHQLHHYHHRDQRDQRDYRDRREHGDYRDQRDQREQRYQRDDRYRRDDDDYHNRYRRDRSPRRNDYGDRRKDRSNSLENRNENQPASNQGSALMNILQKNMGQKNQDMTADLLAILNLPPEKLAELTTSMEKNILNGNSILVRELWLGNLPDNLPEKKLQNAVEMLGDVENIEYFTKPNGSFAFVKFKKVSQASKANEGIQSLRMLLDSPNLKTAFSDHQRRKGVVGDNIDYEKDEELTSIIYIGFNQRAKVTSTNEIKDLFSKYGEVVNVSLAQSRDFNSKPYALVEMGTLEQAKIARERIYLRDDTREKRYRLGDRDCELSILIKAPNKEPGNVYQNQPQQHAGFNPNTPKQMYQQQQGQYQGGQQGYQQRQQPPYQQYPQGQPNLQNPQYNQYSQQQQYGYSKPPYGGDNKNFRQQQQQNYYNQNASAQNVPGGYGAQQQTYGNQMGVQPPTVPNPSQQRQVGYPPQNIQTQGTYMQNQGAQANRYSPGGAMPQAGQMLPTSPGGQNYSPGIAQTRQYPTGGVGPNPSYFPPGSSNPPFNMQTMNQGQGYPGAGAGVGAGVVAGTPTGSVEKRPDEQQKGSSFGLLDTLQDLLAQKNQQQQAPKEPEKPEEIQKTATPIAVEEDENEPQTIWSGFITKNKQNRVGVDANLISGDELILKDYFNLNISHRTLYEEVTKKDPKTIVVFVPANGTQLSLFEEYKKYFEEKQRAGVVTLKKNTLYLLPPCEEAYKIHKIGQNEILGIFTDNSEVVKESIV